MKHVFSILILLQFSFSFAQEFSFRDDTVRIEVELTDPLETATYVINNTDSSVEFTVKRINNNVPSGWSSCFCIPVCLTDKDESLNMTVDANDSSLVNIVSNSNGIYGSASMAIVLFKLGDSTPLDTCYFFQKTRDLSSSIDNNLMNTISVFPNPSQELIHIKINQGIQIDRYYIIDQANRIVKILEANNLNTASIDISSLSKGKYTLVLEDSKGQFYNNFFIKTD